MTANATANLADFMGFLRLRLALHRSAETNFGPVEAPGQNTSIRFLTIKTRLSRSFLQCIENGANVFGATAKTTIWRQEMYGGFVRVRPQSRPREPARWNASRSGWYSRDSLFRPRPVQVGQHQPSMP